MASYRLITDEDKEYISSFMNWLNENITPAQVDQEHFANCIMNIDSLMRFGSGGMDTSDKNAVLPINSVSNSATSCSFKEVKDIWNAAKKYLLQDMGEICKGDATYEEDAPDLNTYYERHYY